MDLGENRERSKEHVVGSPTTLKWQHAVGVDD
jgi:hypothetical protein